MSKVTILSFLGWINEKKPLFNCVNERGREVVLQAATHPDDYSVGRAYHLADVDNENNPNKQRIIPELPTSRWYTAKELAENLPYTLAMAYLYKDAYKNGVPGYRKDVVVGFNDNQVLLKDYGWASLYQGRLPKTYEGSIEAGDEVTVGFDGTTWGTPIAYVWTKRPELPLQQEGGNIVEIIPNWIRILSVDTRDFFVGPPFNRVISTDWHWTFQTSLSVVGDGDEQVVEKISDTSLSGNTLLWKKQGDNTIPSEFVIQGENILGDPSGSSNAEVKIKVEMENGGIVYFHLHWWRQDLYFDPPHSAGGGDNRFVVSVDLGNIDDIIITPVGTTTIEKVGGGNASLYNYRVLKMADYSAPIETFWPFGIPKIALRGDTVGTINEHNDRRFPLTFSLERKYSSRDLAALENIGVAKKGLHTWTWNINLNSLGNKQFSTITEISE